MQYLGAISKMTEWSWFVSKANHSATQQSKFISQPLMLKKMKLTSSSSNEDLQDLLELTPKKRCPFHHRGSDCKSRNSRDTGVTGKFGHGVQNEAGQRLTEFCQENTLVIANILFQQHKRWPYTWTSPDGQHWNQIDYILCHQRWRSSIQSAKTRLGADCGSDHELFITKFRFKLKKVGETTRPFRYDLNQIPYDYTVEVRNRFKELDLIEPDELWTEVRDTVQETGIKTIPIEKKCKKAKWLSEQALQIAVKRREEKSKRKKEIYKHLNAEFQRIARSDKKVSLSG